MAVTEIVAVAILLAGVLVALSLLIKSARGRPLALGITGAVLIFLGVLSRFAFEWMVEQFLGKVADATIVSILAAETAAGGVLTGAGLLLVACAILTADRQPKI
jgi:hypothetical protein